MSRTPAANLLAGAVLLALVAGGALLALAWTPHEPLAIDVVRRLQAPGAAHWLGTDHLGRDVASLLLAGAGNTLLVAVGAVAIGAGIGIPLGLLASADPRIADPVVTRVNDLLFAFPALVLAILLAASFGPGRGNAIWAIGLFNVPVFARVSRAGARALWPREFVVAAAAAGRSKARIAVVHILPNIAGMLVVQATVQASLAVAAEAGLSYVGLGTQPPAPSWGRMLADAQSMVSLAPWLAVAPGAAIAVTVLALNLLGDGLRDRLDPRGARPR